MVGPGRYLASLRHWSPHKKFGGPCTKQTTTRSLSGATAETMFCDIKTERKLTVGFGKKLEIGQLKYFPNLKMH